MTDPTTTTPRPGEPSIGAWSNYQDPHLARAIAESGYDWFCIDEQHGSATAETTAAILERLGDLTVTRLVRVSWNRPEIIGRAFDSGADGVIVPMVESADDAMRAGTACRYPPDGMRSWGPRHSLRSGATSSPADSNAAVRCFVMVETAAALSNLSGIASAPGVDGIFVGPFDLSLSLGITVDELLHDERADSPLTRVIEACHQNGLVAGAYAGSPARAREFADRGFEMVNAATDVALIQEAARQVALAGRDAVESAHHSARAG